MKPTNDLEIFLTAVPGLEAIVCTEALEKGFKHAEITTGGVTITGSWPDVWRANLELRSASRVLVRLGEFRVIHLAKLDKRARQFPWADTLRPDTPVRVEVTCKKSRIYHHKAAAQRIETAIKEELGAEISPDADICIKVRIFDDLCTISVDTSGEALHKRGHKEAVNKAPMRENLAASLLFKCGFNGTEPVVDPMCGSGTFVIEAAEIAAGFKPGRTRNFSFEKLTSFDEKAWNTMRAVSTAKTCDHRFYGFDRDKGAVGMSEANAKRADVSGLTVFKHQSISSLTAPDGPKGLVIINPPYGVRVGEVKKLQTLYQALGKTLRSEFIGWRVGLVTNTDTLARATGMPFKKKPTAFSHGGIPVKLFYSPPLKG